MSAEPEVEIQRRYYARTAHAYEAMHVDKGDEHSFALSFFSAAINHFGFASALEIGAGTGRGVSYLEAQNPGVRVVGIEPVKELREIAYRNGIDRNKLIEGDTARLNFSDGEFDVVCEFAVLHHVKNSAQAVSEMLRVAKKAIFISDCNNFGQGSYTARTVKQIINALGMWRAFNFVKTRGKGYTITEGDGLAYSYSVFNDYDLIRSHCNSIHLLNTKDGHINHYRSSPHVALLGIKK